MFTLKIFYFRYDSRAETRAKLKTDLYFEEMIMQKVSYIPLENILADDPLPRMSKKGWIFDRRRGSQFTVFDKFILASAAHERTTLVISLVKHNVAAKHGSSKPLTSNELWLLEWRIKSTPYIGLHTRCIMGYVQIVYWDVHRKMKLNKCIVGRPGYFFVFGMVNKATWNKKKIKNKTKQSK